jgi:outer membrane receptor protein involved in Fe transport
MPHPTAARSIGGQPHRAWKTSDAATGYRLDRCELRLNGSNLGNRRDPVAESELGEGQYYRLPARFVELNLSFDF